MTIPALIDDDWPEGPEPGAAITILLANEHRLMSAALAALLERHDDLRVVSIVTSGDAIVKECLRSRPAVVLIDSALPGRDAITAARELRLARPTTQCVLLAPTGRAVELHRELNWI